MICKKCGAKFEGNFCPKCGTPAEKELTVCPKCGQERGAGDRYCPKCGYDFARSDRKESVSFGAKAAEAVKKVPKKAWAAIAAIVLVVIAIIVLVSVLSNKFRIGVVEKIEIGDSRESVIELLGEPYDYQESSSTFTYYSNNYLKLLEKNDSFDPDDIEDWGDFEDAFNEAMELEQKLQTEEYKYIEVRFDGEGCVESVFFDVSRTEETKGAAKAVKTYEMLGNDNVDVEYYVKYSDGSYFLGSTSASLEFEGENTYLQWRDRFGNELKTPMQTDEEKGWVYDPKTQTLYVIANEISNIPNDVVNVEIVDGVKEIDSSAFSGCRSLSSITISDGVTSIGGSAFHGCDSLTSISIPNSVTSIGESAFEDCDSLTSVTIGDGVTEIGGSAFSGCDSLTSITIGDSVTSIGGSAFSNCDSLTSITIGDSVTSIGGSAFSNCDSLTSIVIPDSVISIGDYAFYDCSIRYASIPALAIRYIPKGDLQTVVITSGTSIGDEAFEYCSSLTSITIPDSVTSIGDRAFNGCDSLTSITIPDSVTSIGDRAFNGCISLTSISIPDSVTSIGDYAFRNCSSLTSITIPDSVTFIGDDAFRGCSGLTSVYISDLAAWCGITFESANSNPLAYAGNLYLNDVLVTDLVIPDSVASIGSRAFYGGDSLTSIVIPDSVTSIGKSAFSGCPIQYASIPALAIDYIPQGNLQTVVITSGTTIGNYAFSDCSSLTSITIPGSVTSIGSGAFNGCSGLTSMTIPDSVTSIGSHAFWSCSSLMSITIPDSVTSIGSHAFYDCNRLETVYYRGSEAEWNEIEIGIWNGDLEGAEIIFNYKGE